MALLSSMTAHSEDQALHDDVRLLGALLGSVIRRMEGEECFLAVEHLRTGCRARLQGAPGAPSLEDLLAYVDALPAELTARVARAFTLFFLLINAAEQVHQTRPEGRAEGGTELLRNTFSQLRERGVEAAEAASLLERLEVRPVLTAHPTEATRATLLGLQARVADKLIAREQSLPEARKAVEEELEAEAELLWLTAELRSGRPSVLDEVDNALWYLRNRLVRAGAGATRDVERAFRDVYGSALEKPPLVKWGSWVGGDRDGNPFVTPETTVEAARRAARTMAEVYLADLERLNRTLSVSTRVRPAPAELLQSLEADRTDFPEIWEQTGSSRPDEALRLKLLYVAERLRALRKRFSSDSGLPTHGRRALYPGGSDVEPAPKGAYCDPAELERDLLLVRRSLVEAGAEEAGRIFVDPLLLCVRMYGFHGFRLDVREDSRVLAKAAAEFALEPDATAREALHRALLAPAPSPLDIAGLTETARRTLDVFRSIGVIQHEVGAAGASTYIVSMTKSPEDLLRVLFFGREAGLVDLSTEPPRSALDVVPLFETGEDLLAAPTVMRDLFADPAYRAQLRARGLRQEVMVGYSDSAKDVGLIGASWCLYRAQEQVSRVARQAGVALTFFHGRGGTVGRGGGSPVLRGLLALPPGTVDGRIKITEQGEVIAQKYGLVPVAQQILEATLAGTMLATVDAPEDEAAEPPAPYRSAMDRMAELSQRVYRERVYEHERLFSFFLEATPVRELARVHFGSRPAYREGAENLNGLRAIPWIFGWTQTRFNAPSWLGVGTALETLSSEPGGLALLQEMALSWRFFDDLLSKIEMICAKTDPEIARLYVERLRPADADLFDELTAEFRRTVKAILEIRRAKHLLENQRPLRTALAHREPYLDPLSLLQVSLLGRKRTLPPDHKDLPAVQAAVATTLSGLAQGLHNTG